jgi:hypothetical protein
VGTFGSQTHKSSAARRGAKNEDFELCHRMGRTRAAKWKQRPIDSKSHRSPLMDLSRCCDLPCLCIPCAGRNCFPGARTYHGSAASVQCHRHYPAAAIVHCHRHYPAAATPLWESGCAVSTCGSAAALPLHGCQPLHSILPSPVVAVAKKFW